MVDSRLGSQANGSAAGGSAMSRPGEQRSSNLTGADGSAAKATEHNKKPGELAIIMECKFQSICTDQI